MAKIITREWTSKGPEWNRVQHAGVLALGLLLAGCVSATIPMGYTNTAIADAKQGHDCHVRVAIGGIPDLSGAQAMRQGGITKLRSAEYRENTFHGIGHTCMVAHGE
jgi:hypothetical protein